MRPKSEEYLITTTTKAKSRKFVWSADESLELDVPGTWKLEKTDTDKFLVSLPGDPEFEKGIPVQLPKGTLPIRFALPASKFVKDSREVQVELRMLQHPRPVYTITPTQEALHVKGPQQLCVFYGQRYFLIRYRPVKKAHHRIFTGSLPVLDYQFDVYRGYIVKGYQAGLKVSVGGNKRNIPVNGEIVLSSLEFFRASFILGVHWWRFRMVPTPDAQPPLETDETDEDVRESDRLTISAASCMFLLAMTLIGMLIVAKFNPPPPRVIATNVELKKPKMLPPLPKVAEKPTPAPPKVVELEKPKPKEEPVPIPKVKPKEKPKPIVAKKEPKLPPKKVVETPKPLPKKVATAPELPKKIVKAPEPVVTKAPAPAPTGPPAPSPAEVAAAKAAVEKAVQQKQLLQSLSFLSSSPKASAVDAKNYEVKSGKFANTAAVGGDKSTTNNLDKIAKNATGDGTINTKSSRMVASDIKFGKNKGLNDVQGQVSLGKLYAAGSPGSGLESGSGIEISGPGQINDGLIEKALAKYLNRFQFCYEKALLNDASLSGDLKVGWTVTTSGAAKDGKVIRSAMNNKDLHSCVLNVLKEIPFPAPKGGSVNVSKVFKFSSSSM